MRYESTNQGVYHNPGPKLSVVQEEGQVTIPAEIRRKWGLEKGNLAFVVVKISVDKVHSAAEPTHVLFSNKIG